LVGSFLYGFIFSLGTSAAPLLLLLTVAAAQARPEYGFILALAFGIGRGLPFLLAGIFAGLLI
jgi:cytochrome c-type biogenesis protein